MEHPFDQYVLSAKTLKGLLLIRNARLKAREFDYRLSVVPKIIWRGVNPRYTFMHEREAGYANDPHGPAVEAIRGGEQFVNRGVDCSLPLEDGHINVAGSNAAG